MTESFRYEDHASERVQLEDGQVEVFFDAEAGDIPASIILETAESQIATLGLPYHLVQYEQLLLQDGIVLKPADLSNKEHVSELALNLETVMRMGAGALLRTQQYREELKFLDIVKNDTLSTERKEIRKIVSEEEERRISILQDSQREMFDKNKDLELWVRLEAGYNPDMTLVGKIIMARLAFLTYNDVHVGASPMVYSANENVTTRIPEQLVLHENWLYYELP